MTKLPPCPCLWREALCLACRYAGVLAPPPLYLGEVHLKGRHSPFCGDLYLPAKGPVTLPIPGVEEEAANVEWEGGWDVMPPSLLAVCGIDDRWPLPLSHNILSHPSLALLPLSILSMCTLTSTNVHMQLPAWHSIPLNSLLLLRIIDWNQQDRPVRKGWQFCHWVIPCNT